MTKTRIIRLQNPRQANRLLRFLLESQKGRTFNGHTARAFFNDLYGIDADWHEYVNTLEEMQRLGMVDYDHDTASFDGMTNYYINLHPRLD